MMESIGSTIKFRVSAPPGSPVVPEVPPEVVQLTGFNLSKLGLRLSGIYFPGPPGIGGVCRANDEGGSGGVGGGSGGVEGGSGGVGGASGSRPPANSAAGEGAGVPPPCWGDPWGASSSDEPSQVEQSLDYDFMLDEV